MITVVVVGAGQLGSRHLQGLASLDIKCRYFVVDPSPGSLDMARHRVSETKFSEANERIEYLTSLDGLPDIIDYAVIATTADVRLNALQCLLSGRRVRNILLEKVLFQRVSDYSAASDLISSAKANAWVNCPRRIFPVYQRVKEFFEGQELLHFQVHGGNWGLGCNSIHFLDLAAFLTGAFPRDLSTAAMDLKLIDSKRKNFYEFTGVLRGACGAASVDICSLSHAAMPLVVLLRSESRTCFINESAGQAFFLDPAAENACVNHSFRNPLMSELSASIAYDVLVHENTTLTKFADSVACHLPLIRALGSHAAPEFGSSEYYCPIT